MKSFFSGLMKGVETTRNVLLNVFFLVFVTFFVVTLMNVTPSLPDKVILQLDMEGALVEQVKQPDFGFSALTAPQPVQVKVHDVVTALKRAAKDDRVLGLRLDLEKLKGASLPHMQAVKKAIDTFKASGKPVMAYADQWTQAQYYLAASADEVYLHPMGNIALNGYSLYRNYIRDVLEKLEVDVHVFRAGKYKSAAAPFIQSEMSALEREANKSWLDTLWTVYKDDLFAMRGIKQERLQYVLDHPTASIQKYDGDLSQLFLAEHWVDGLLYAEQADAMLMAKVGEAELVGFHSYLMASGDGFLPTQPQSADNWVGVITGSGQILNGEQPSGTIGSDTMVELLHNALEDERIKAVVLRLNTPGGSALASESIRHAVEVLRGAGKPVVVSMGSMAASGGYWIAASADEIWASPATLTGSIGVFGIVPNIHRGLKKLGVQTDGLGTTSIAGALRIDKPLSAELSDSIQLSINQTYAQFTQHVADGRDLDLTRVKELAEGRVWSGLDAKRLGLVDELGDINDAIKAAARLANIEDNHEPIIIDLPMNAFDMLLTNVLSEVSVTLGLNKPTSGLASMVQILDGQLKEVMALNDPRGVYALSSVNVVE
ncbi:MAG: signal peptide peptidase SppA [Ghiorsea sp.]